MEPKISELEDVVLAVSNAWTTAHNVLLSRPEDNVIHDDVNLMLSDLVTDLKKQFDVSVEALTTLRGNVAFVQATVPMGPS
jgi:hypothetical protein